MNPKIIPAINAGSLSEVASAMKRLERELSGHQQAPTHIHIDIADGTLTPNVLWHNPEDLEKLSSSFRIELHLMLSDMDTRFQFWLRPHINRYIVQFEGCEKPRSVASAAKRIGKEFGFSLAPHTDPSAISDVAGHMDVLQLLAVSPGRAGQKMDVGTIKKIATAKKLYPTLPIAIDGGINEMTIGPCAVAGASRFVAASYLFGGDNIRAQYDALLKKIDQS